MAISDGVVYWYVRDPKKAMEIQMTVLFFVAFLGVLCWDLAKSLVFDIKLLISTFRGPHWRDPVRMLSRICYFVTQITGFTGNICPILYITLTHADCHPWKLPMLLSAIICNSAFSTVFACRAYVVSHRNWKYGIFLLTYLLGVSAFGCYVYVNFGQPVRVPNSKFCVWIMPHVGERIVSLDHTYIALVCIFDFAVLLMTLHSLVEGGLPTLISNSGPFFRTAIGYRREDDPELAWGSLSQHLVEQGVALYATFELLRLGLVILMAVMPYYIMPTFLRAAFQNGLNPVIVRMLFRGQAYHLSNRPLSQSRSNQLTIALDAPARRVETSCPVGSSWANRETYAIAELQAAHPAKSMTKVAELDGETTGHACTSMWCSTTMIDAQRRSTDQDRRCSFSKDESSC